MKSNGKSRVRVEKDICDEFISNIPSPFDNADPDLLRLLADDNDDEDIIITSKREGSAKYGRRSMADFDIRPTPLGSEESSYLENILRPDLLCTERKTSAKYGRRSQSDQASRSSSIVSADACEAVDFGVRNRLDESISEAEFMNLTIMKSDDDGLKNSAPYRRRASQNNFSLLFKNISASSNKRISDKGFSDSSCNSKISEREESNAAGVKYSDKRLEESWKSLSVFNKKHRGRISDGKTVFYTNKIFELTGSENF